MTRFTNISTLSATMLTAALLATGGGVAQAAHKAPVREPLVRLAVNLEGATRELSYRAEHFSHHGTQREARALRQFDRLQHEAREFRVTLQRRGPLSSRTEREYGELLTAFDRAERALYNVHARRPVRKNFNEVELRLNQLGRALQAEIASARRPYRGNARISRAWPRYGLSEIAYSGRFANADLRIRYVKREDGYDRDDRRSADTRGAKRRGNARWDDDSSD